MLTVVPFTPGNLAILRIGGSNDLAFEATETFIDEYTQAGVFVQSIPFADSGPNAFTESGNTFTDGGMTRTANGQYLVATGYRADNLDLGVDGAGPAAEPSSTTPRVIGRVAVDGTIDTTTALTNAYSGTSFRGVASQDGTSFYVSGNNGSSPSFPGGLQYVANLGDSASTLITNYNDNLRQVYVVDGNLYVASSSGNPSHSFLQVGAGLPTTGGQTYTATVGAPGNEFYNSALMADLDPTVPGFDTIYIVDSGSGVSSIDKWSLVGGVWTANNSSSGNQILTPAGHNSAFGLAGYVQGNTVKLFITTTSSGGAQPTSLYTITDTSGYNAPNNGFMSFLLNSSVNKVFKTVALVPRAAPVVTTTGGTAGYTENGAAVAVDPTLTITDSDSANLYSATVTITGNFDPAQDTLTFTPAGGITGAFSSVSGQLKLWGTASKADYQTVLQSVKYQNSSDNPTVLSRTITFKVHDNSDVESTAATRGVTITAVNDAPINTVPGAQIVGISHALTFSSLNANLISIADVDAQSGNLLLTLSVPAGHGILTLSTLAGLTGTGQGTDSLSYSGTLAAINTALNGLVYNSPGSAQVVSLSVGIDDQGNTGTGGAMSDSDSVSITVTNVPNSPPVVTTTGGAVAYTENDAATVIDSGLTVTDSDNSNLVGATVAVTGNYVQGQDVLSFTNMLGITGSFDAPSGVLTLSGVTTKVNYQAALRTVKYVNTSELPSTLARTVTFVASDGSDPSNNATRTINVTSINDAPVVTVPGSQSFAKDANHVFSALAGNQISFSDVDSNGQNEQITVAATHGTITLATLAGLSGSGNGTANMTYTGSIANLNAAMNGMTFMPTPAYTGSASVTVTANDLGNTGTPSAQSGVGVVSMQINDPGPLLINEVALATPTSTSSSQYIELRSTTGGSYAIPSDTYLVSVEGRSSFNTGEVHDVFDLAGAGMSTGTNGYLVILPSMNLYNVNGLPDPNSNVYEQGGGAPGFGDILTVGSTVGHSSDAGFTSLENANSTTLFLVRTSTPPVPGDDIDVNDDGIPDGATYNGWTVVDSIGRGDYQTQAGNHVYGAINYIDPTGTTTALVGTTISTNFTASYLGRSGDTTGSSPTDWVASRLQGSNPFWEVSLTKSSQPGFGGLPLDHMGSTNFPGILVKPVADLNGGLDGRDSVASFIAGAGAIPVFSTTAAVTDTDSTNLSGIVVTITNLLDGANESLAATTSGTSIRASYSSGVLTLSGSDTLAHYQQVLRTVMYNNVAGSPNLTTRALTVVANDGVNSSLTSNAQIGMFRSTNTVRLNEIDADPPGTDNPYEYIELRGDPGASLSNLYVVAFEGHRITDINSPNYGQEGKATFVQALSGTLPSNGLLAIKSPTGGFTIPSPTTVVTNADLDTAGGGLTNGSNSFYLISSSTPLVKGTDYDTNTDGKLELPGSAEVIDSIAWKDRNFEQDIAYGTNLLTQFNDSPAAATRFYTNLSQKSSAWFNGALDETGINPAQLNYDPTNGSSNLPLTASITPGAQNTVTSNIAGTGHEGRYIFYNNSKFDGNSGANNVSDNSAIPSNKTVYLPGDGQMVLANITNFTKGLNGIMVDLTVGSADHTTINASDFVFKVGENNSPNTWTTLTATPTISVRTGGGISGSDRVDITWADNAIQDQYLEVQVLATAHTGLNPTFGTISGNAVGDIFFFGNLRGETASTTPASFLRIFASDGAAIQAAGTIPSAGINSFLDVDRNNLVISGGDRAALLPLGTKALVRISIGTAGPFAPEGGGAAPATASGDAGVSSGLAATTGSSSSSSSSFALPASVAARLDSAGSTVGVVSTYGQLLEDAGAAADDAAFEIDEEILDSLVAGLSLE